MTFNVRVSGEIVDCELRGTWHSLPLETSSNRAHLDSTRASKSIPPGLNNRVLIQPFSLPDPAMELW